MKFIRTFVNFGKATISFVISVRTSVCLSLRMEQLGSNWKNLYKNLIFNGFSKISEKVQV